MIRKYALVLFLVATLSQCAGEANAAERKNAKKSNKAKAAATKTPQAPKLKMPAPEVLEKSIQRGVDFLLQDQNKDGSWGTAERTKDLNIYAPVPGSHHAFRTAVTALCICALVDIDSDDPKVEAAIKRGEAWIVERLPQLRRANPTALYNVWGHAYSIQALSRMHNRADDAKSKTQIEDLIRSQYDFLTRYESVDGGWGYYDFRLGTKRPTSSSISFTTATALVAFHEAKQIGVEPPNDLVKRAYDSIKRQQKNDLSYMYGEYLKMAPMAGINRPSGSLGRSQACNIAMKYWGDEKITDEMMKIWLHRLFARNGWLSMGRKRPVPHESWDQVAGYFYYYGHYYAGLCIEDLPASEREIFQANMAHTLMPLQEKDGSWWDFPFYNYYQQYGTAFALLTLERCRPVN